MYLNAVRLVHVHHAIKESPEKDVSEEASHKPPGEQQSSRFERLVPLSTSFEYKEEGEEERGKEVEDKTVQCSQTKNARCGSRQGRHRGPAVIQHSGISPDSHLADELWSFTFGYQRRHALLRLCFCNNKENMLTWVKAVTFTNQYKLQVAPRPRHEI